MLLYLYDTTVLPNLDLSPLFQQAGIEVQAGPVFGGVAMLKSALAAPTLGPSQAKKPRLQACEIRFDWNHSGDV